MYRVKRIRARTWCVRVKDKSGINSNQSICGPTNKLTKNRKKKDCEPNKHSHWQKLTASNVILTHFPHENGGGHCFDILLFTISALAPNFPPKIISYYSTWYPVVEQEVLVLKQINQINVCWGHSFSLHYRINLAMLISEMLSILVGSFDGRPNCKHNWVCLSTKREMCFLFVLLGFQFRWWPPRCQLQSSELSISERWPCPFPQFPKYPNSPLGVLMLALARIKFPAPFYPDLRRFSFPQHTHTHTWGKINKKKRKSWFHWSNFDLLFRCAHN